MKRWTNLLAAFALVGTPAAAAERVHNVGLNSAELIRLNRTPAIILVANPQILDVVLEQNRLMFLLGKAVGQTRLFVLDAEGRDIWTTDVVVAPGEEQRVFVQRGTAERVLVCNPRCVIESEGAGNASAAPAGGDTGAAAAAASAAAAPGAAPPPDQ
ncbi:MAG: hypothetical protein FJX61_09515 [Alphaproteobacteria bacterium]|nr:hypothetical protein [Alphaproteobacteria bacterium]